MSLGLPADIAAQVQAQLATGQFQSEEQVLREALTMLRLRQQGLDRLKSLVSEGEADIAAGRVGYFDRDELKREVRALLSAQGIAD